MKEIIDNVLLTCIGLFFLFIGIWGTIDFNNFRNWYMKFMDKRNSLNVKYPKGNYSKVVLRGFVAMSLVMGLIIVGSMVLIYLNILEG